MSFISAVKCLSALSPETPSHRSCPLCASGAIRLPAEARGAGLHSVQQPLNCSRCPALSLSVHVLRPSSSSSSPIWPPPTGTALTLGQRLPVELGRAASLLCRPESPRFCGPCASLPAQGQPHRVATHFWRQQPSQWASACPSAAPVTTAILPANNFLRGW